jgi:hypothetical protein
MEPHTHANGFEHLDLKVADLGSQMHLGWKLLLPATDGPPGYPGEPYIPLAASVEISRRWQALARAPRIRTQPFVSGRAATVDGDRQRRKDAA